MRVAINAILPVDQRNLLIVAMAAEKCSFTGLIDSIAAPWEIILCLSRSPYYGGPQR